MKNFTAVRALAALAFIAASVAVATPAQAAGRTLPAGDALYTLACDSGEPELFSVDGASAASTLVGSGGVEGCGYDPAYDAASGAVYALVADGESYLLVTVDTATGVSTLVGTILDGEEAISVDSLTIAGGVAYVTSYDELWTVELSSGAATFVGVVAGIDDNIYGLATNPVDGRIYGIEQSGDLLQIDPVGLVATLIDTFTTASVFNEWGLDIDSSGIFWIVTNQDGGEDPVPGLWSFDQTDVNGSALESGQLLVGGEYFYTFTAVIVPIPVPTLAETGVDATPLLVGSAVLGLAGIALVMTRRRQTA